MIVGRHACLSGSELRTREIKSSRLLVALRATSTPPGPRTRWNRPHPARRRSPGTTCEASFLPAVALDQRFRQVAEHAGHADRQAEADLAAQIRRAAPAAEAVDRHGRHAPPAPMPPAASLPGLLRAEHRRHAVPAEQPAGEVGADVAALRHEDRQRQGQRPAPQLSRPASGQRNWARKLGNSPGRRQTRPSGRSASPIRPAPGRSAISTRNAASTHRRQGPHAASATGQAAVPGSSGRWAAQLATTSADHARR